MPKGTISDGKRLRMLFGVTIESWKDLLKRSGNPIADSWLNHGISAEFCEKTSYVVISCHKELFYLLKSRFEGELGEYFERNRKRIGFSSSELITISGEIHVGLVMVQSLLANVLSETAGEFWGAIQDAERRVDDKIDKIFAKRGVMGRTEIIFDDRRGKYSASIVYVKKGQKRKKINLSDSCLASLEIKIKSRLDRL